MPGIKSDNRSSRRVIISNQPYNKTQKNSNTFHQKQFNSINTKLYVGNLSYNVTWQDLKDHMKIAGRVVRADILEDASSGRSKGCGIVEYEDQSSAINAIEKLNNTELKGRLIFIREDREANNNSYNSNNNNITIHNNTIIKEDQQSHLGRLGISRTIYVGNLSYGVTWQDLKDHFKTIGHVLHADILVDNDNNRSKGCGTVEYANINDADDAIIKLNNTELKGRMIFVREDRLKNDDYNNGNHDNRRLYIGNLSWNTSWQDLKDHFKTIGPVSRADIIMEDNNNSDNKRSKGYGIVEYINSNDAIIAIQELNNSLLDNRNIYVREDREEKRRY